MKDSTKNFRGYLVTFAFFLQMMKLRPKNTHMTFPRSHILLLTKLGPQWMPLGPLHHTTLPSISSQWRLCQAIYQYSYSPNSVSSLTAGHCITRFGFLEKSLENVQKFWSKITSTELGAELRVQIGRIKDYWRLIIVFSLYSLYKVQIDTTSFQGYQSHSRSF